MDALTVDRQRGNADTQASSPVSPFDGRQLRRLSGQFTSSSRATASQPSPSEKVTTPTSKNFVPRHSVPSPATPSSQSAGERVPVTEQAPRNVNRWRKEPTSLPAQGSLALKNKETIDRRDRVNENPVRRSSKWTPPPPFKLSDRPGNYTKHTRRDSDRDRPGTSQSSTSAPARRDLEKTKDDSVEEKDAKGDTHDNRSDRTSAATGEPPASRDPPAASALETPQALNGLLMRIGERYTNHSPSPAVQQRGEQRTSSSPGDTQPSVPAHTKDTTAGGSAGPSRPRLRIVFRQPHSTDPGEPPQRATSDLTARLPPAESAAQEAVASPTDGSDPPGTHTFANRDAAQVDTSRTSRRQRYSSKTPSLGSLYTSSDEDPDSEAELPRYKPRGGVSRKETAGQAQALANVQAEAPNRLLASSAPAGEAVVATASSGTAPVVGPVVSTSETVQSGFEEQNAPPAEIAGSVDDLLLQLATPAARAQNRSRSRSAYSASPHNDSPAKSVPAKNEAAQLPPIDVGNTANATARSAGTEQLGTSATATENTPFTTSESTTHEVEEEVAGEDSDATLSGSLFSERSSPDEPGDATKKVEPESAVARMSRTVLNGSVRLSPESSDEAELCAPTGDGMLTPPPTAALFGSIPDNVAAKETPGATAALLLTDTVCGAQTLLSLRAARQNRGCDTPERRSGKESEDAASPETHPSAVLKEAVLDTAEPQSTPAGIPAEEAPQPDSAESPGVTEADSSRKRKEAPTPEPSAERPAPTRKRRKPATLEPEPLPWSCHKKTRTAAKLFYQAAGLLHKNASAEDRATINEWIATFDGLMED